jgi:CheY-like chemotaxis protein
MINCSLHVSLPKKGFYRILYMKIASISFLVIEDNAFTSIVVCKALQSLGATQVETARTGRKALNRITSMNSPPDVLLLDLRMPEMGGVELLRWLAEQHYTGHVILTTGVDEQTLIAVEDIARKSDVNILGRLPKPINAQALSDLLSQLPQNVPDKTPASS